MERKFIICGGIFVVLIVLVIIIIATSMSRVGVN